jgi:hypothetical protein
MTTEPGLEFWSPDLGIIKPYLYAHQKVMLTFTNWQDFYLDVFLIQCPTPSSRLLKAETEMIP